MARNLRSKASSTQASEKPTSDPPDTSKSGLRSRQAGSGIRSSKETKGNGKKSIDNVLITLKSPVLRDRTNFITELPNIDVLKKGGNDRRDASVKPVTKRTRIPSKTDEQKKPKDDVKPTKISRPVRKVQKKELVEPKPAKNTLKTSEPVGEAPKKPLVKKSSIPKASAPPKATKNTGTSQQIPQPKRSLRISSRNESKVEADKKFVNSKLKKPLSVPAEAKPTVGKVKKPVTVKTASRLKQTTLKDSFSKTKTPNRRSKSIKNSPKATTTSKAKSPAKNPDPKDKKPIYKSVNMSDTMENDKEKVYEFDYDCNDSQERIVSKKRKKPVRRAPVKRQKTTEKPLKVAEKLVEVKKSLPTVKSQPPLQPAQSPSEPHSNVVVTVAEVYDAPSSPKRKPEPFTLPKDVKKPTPKCVPIPRIISDEILNREHYISFPSTLETNNDVENIGPWRATNVFSTRPTLEIKSMMNHSLLQQAISPIKKKVIPDFDVGSPWRPNIPVEAFSRVRNVVQSTPQSKTLPEKLPTHTRNTMPKIDEQNDANSDKLVTIPSQENPVEVIQSSEEAKSPQKLPVEVVQPSEETKSPQKNSVDDIQQSQEAVSPQKSPVKIVRPLQEVKSSMMKMVQRIEKTKSPRKSPIKKFNESKSPQKSPGMLLMSPRKFGTEISNLGDPRTSNSPRKFGNDLSNTSNTSNPSRKFGNEISNTSNGSTRNKSSPAMVRGVNLAVEPKDVMANEKENSSPNCEEAEMSPSSYIRTPSMSPLTPLKETAAVRLAEPQLGSPGLYKSPTRLKQTNLNSFLNLPPMPESTRISTADGIFDDVHSTPITATVRAATKLPVSEETSCLDVGISPISSRVIRPENTKDAGDFAAKPSRFSIGQMRRALATQIDEGIQVDTFEKNKVEDPVKHIAEFSDVFDCGDDQVDEKNIEECRLFMDLEPIHFKEPPKYSYKRKRTQSLNSSGEIDSDVDDEDDEVAGRRKRVSKKKRMGKVQRKQHQQLNEWAKNLNQTFDEIEHFDLVVEPVHEKNK